MRRLWQRWFLHIPWPFKQSGLKFPELQSKNCIRQSFDNLRFIDWELYSRFSSFSCIRMSLQHEKPLHVQILGPPAIMPLCTVSDPVSISPHIPRAPLFVYSGWLPMGRVCLSVTGDSCQNYGGTCGREHTLPGGSPQTENVHCLSQDPIQDTLLHENLRSGTNVENRYRSTQTSLPPQELFWESCTISQCFPQGTSSHGPHWSSINNSLWSSRVSSLYDFPPMFQIQISTSKETLENLILRSSLTTWIYLSSRPWID